MWCVCVRELWVTTSLRVCVLGSDGDKLPGGRAEPWGGSMAPLAPADVECGGVGGWGGGGVQQSPDARAYPDPILGHGPFCPTSTIYGDVSHLTST